MFTWENMGSTSLKASATQMLSVAEKKKNMIIYQYHTICAAFVHIYHILWSLIVHCFFFASEDFLFVCLFVSVSLTTAKYCASMCQ